MQIGMIGLGRMGASMVRRLRSAGIDVVGYDREPDTVKDVADASGMSAAASVEALVAQLDTPRTVWLMLPAGEVTQQQVDQLAASLSPGDTVVDGANSWFRDSMRRGADLASRGIDFVDVGVSGGIWGLEAGYALMVGGQHDAVVRLEPVRRARAPAPDRGWLHCGPSGSGHYVKMIHNGIEYGMMQAYAEGFALMKAREDFNLDLAAIAESWRHGSVVRSWLLDLTAGFLADDAALESIEPYAAESGAGRWTAIEAIEQGVPAPVITSALMVRFASQGQSDYTARLLAMMRAGFGGHDVKHRGGE
jgi:6-phosphogluconate dehydrogenase